MSTALFTHPACLRHETPSGHPERVDRLRAVLAALEDEQFAALIRREAPPVALDLAAALHSSEMLASTQAAVEAAQARGGAAAIDGDTCVCGDSWQAALHAAGACVAAVDAVLGGEARSAFCAVRPPGHHAERDRAMGFCLLNTVAIAARHALDAHGLERVAIVDFDVHHGNGTADIFADDPRVLYISTHEWPLFPGTGRESDTGAGNLVNVTLPTGCGPEAFRLAFESAVDPAIDRHRPQLLLISAGFDAHAADPLATIQADVEEFEWMTERLCALAERHCDGAIVSTLEGGYDLRALQDGVAAHVATLMRHAQK
ncbi:MAG: histone deacetylase family protein [Pseudomonadota bacterium]